MQLNKQTDLSLRVMMYLSLHPEEKVTIKEMAETYGVSKNHLVKVVNKLVNLRFIQSTQGRGGGLSLQIKPEDVTVGDIIRNVENSLDVIDCSSDNCPLLPACRLKSALNKATEAFIEVLENYTIADLISNKSHILTLLDIREA